MIRRQLTLPAQPNRVWEALTDPDEAESWLGGRIEWEPAEGGPLHFESTAGEVRDGVVETVRPGRHLSFRWWPAHGSGPGEGSDPGDASEVTYILEPAGEGTLLTVQEAPVADTWTALDSLRLQMYAGAGRSSLCGIG